MSETDRAALDWFRSQLISPERLQPTERLSFASGALTRIGRRRKKNGQRTGSWGSSASALGQQLDAE